MPTEGNISLAGAIVRALAGYHDTSLVRVPLASGIGLKQAALVGQIAGMLALVATALFLWWCVYRKQHHEAVKALSMGIMATMVMLTFPLTWMWGLILFLVPLATTLLAVRQIPRPSLWCFVLFAVGLLPVIAPQITLMLPYWLVDQEDASLKMPGTILFGLPTYGLVLVAMAQGLLLLRLLAPQSEPIEHTKSIV